MALPKDLKIKLKSLLKDGAELPDELDDAVYFPNDGAFMAAVESKSKTKLGAAEAKAAEAQQLAKDREEKLTSTLKGMGIDDVGKIDEFMTKWKAAEGSLTEVDALKVELKDRDKTIGKLTKDVGDLSGFKVTVLKDKAIEPHLAKVAAEFRPLVRANVLGSMVIDDKGNVTGPEGKGIDAVLDELIKATPSLKAPDFKAGPGTGPNGGPPSPTPTAPTPAPTGLGADGKPIPAWKQISETLKAENAKANGGAPPGP